VVSSLSGERTMVTVENCVLIFYSWLITVFVTRVTRRLAHVEQEMLTLPEHLSPRPVFSRLHVARSLVFCVVTCRSLFDSFSVWPLHCVSFELRLLINYPFGIFKLFSSKALIHLTPGLGCTNLN